MSTPEPGAAATLRGLIRPLYAPSALYSVGVGAAIPAQVLVGLRLGLAAPAVSLLVAVSGAAMVGGTWCAGGVIERLGERRALVLATTTGVLPVLALVAVLWLRLPGAVVLYALVLAAFNASDGVWGVARQELMATWVPAPVRGRAVNTYGASQRAGRLVGPFMAGAVVLAIGPVGGFAVFAFASVLGLLALLTAPEPSWTGGGDRRDGAAAPTGAEPAAATVSAEPVAPVIPGAPDRPAAPVRSAVLAGRSRSEVRSAFWVVGAGILALTVVRGQQEVLLPLWSAEVVGLPDAMVSVAIGVSLALEMALFYPAGLVLDRRGSLPVVCACLLGLATGFALLLVPGGFWPGICLIGLGGGIGSGIVKTIGLELAPATGRPRFLGRWSALASGGTMVAPLLVAVLGGTTLTAPVLATAGIGAAGSVWLATAGRRWLGRRGDDGAAAGPGPGADVRSPLRGMSPADAVGPLGGPRSAGGTRSPGGKRSVGGTGSVGGGGAGAGGSDQDV